jgi:uracil-DNA glycosylase family 4
MATTDERRDELKAVFLEARGCTRCPELAATRTQVVFGAGNADADLMFVGEAPGAREDERGLPFVGAAGKLLEELLGEVGFAREDVFIANVLKCRPPGNRDPQPAEIENCQEYLFRQVELIRPKVICTLGNFATKLLRADPAGITKVHGQAEVRVVGTRAVRLYPIHHPAAALYTRSLQGTLREDFARLPGLLAEPEPEQPAPQPVPDAEQAPDLVEGRPGVAAPEALPEEPAPEPEQPGADQLGLF